MIQGNAVDCNKNRKGTGLIDCLLKLKQYYSFLVVTDPNWRLNIATDTFDSEYIQSKIQDKTFIPFLQTLEFTNNTPDPTNKEYQGGDVAIIRNGKPAYMFEFDNGKNWHALAYAYNSFRAYGLLLVDKAGNVEGAHTLDGLYMKAYGLNYFNVRTYTPVTGDETAKTLIEFQIRNEEEFNTRPYIVSAGNVGMDINEDVFGVVAVNITAVGAASVANGLTVDIMAGALNNSFGIEGFLAANLRVRNITDDTVQAIGTVTAGAIPGRYTITFTPALTLADVIVVETYDATATPPVAVAKLSVGEFYEGASAELTVGA